MDVDGMANGMRAGGWVVGPSHRAPISAPSTSRSLMLDPMRCAISSMASEGVCDSGGDGSARVANAGSWLTT